MVYSRERMLVLWYGGWILGRRDPFAVWYAGAFDW